jgi:hypothetical protein
VYVGGEDTSSTPSTATAARQTYTGDWWCSPAIDAGTIVDLDAKLYVIA